MKTYDGQDVKVWSVSEKYDGVQGVWDGRVLRTKSGNEIFAPTWWTKGLPRFASFSGVRAEASLDF